MGPQQPVVYLILLSIIRAFAPAFSAPSSQEAIYKEN
jgi:hypothetical protein